MRLTPKQRQELTTLLRQRLDAHIHARARALLAADQGGSHVDIARASGLGISAVRQLRRRFVEGGLDAALYATPKPLIRIALTRAERGHLTRLARQAPDATWRPQRACLLLEMDRGATDTEVAQRFHAESSTLSELRRRYAEGGIEAALHAKGMKRGLVKLTDAHRRRILALARSTPPAPHRRWQLRALTHEVIKRGIVDYISHESIRKILTEADYPRLTRSRRAQSPRSRS